MSGSSDTIMLRNKPIGTVVSTGLAIIAHLGCGVTPRAEVNVPAGSFTMGCNSALDALCAEPSSASELPAHEISLRAYSIEKYEVTVDEYLQCQRAGACEIFAPDPKQECNFAVDGSGSGSRVRATSGRGGHPINCVTWSQARAFCEWTGRRLPTEAEWERAARGSDGRVYPWGNSPVPGCDTTVLADLSCPEPGTRSVGGRPRGESPFGAEDMSGNVYEWVADVYDGTYYSKTPRDDPKGPAQGGVHVVRGGSWRYGPNGAADQYKNTMAVFRTSHRDALVALDPSTALSDEVGFRCAQEVR